WASLSIASSLGTLGLISDSCSSAREFVPRCLPTRPCSRRPCGFSNCSPPSGSVRDLHPRAVDHARHTIKKPLLAEAFRLSELPSPHLGENNHERVKRQ